MSPRVDAQQAGGRGVEGAAPDAVCAPPGVAARREHRLDPAEHLGGGAAREGEQQDAPRVGAALDEVGDAVDERGGLAGAGAGDDEQGPSPCCAAASCRSLRSTSMRSPPPVGPAAG